jgi:hypothetical protein
MPALGMLLALAIPVPKLGKLLASSKNHASKSEMRTISETECESFSFPKLNANDSHLRG